MATKTETINLTHPPVWINNENVYSNTEINANYGCPVDEVGENNTNTITIRNSVGKEWSEIENDDRSSSSGASEIAKLADVTISEDAIDDYDGVCAKNIKDEEVITNLIEAAINLNSTSIDLSKRKLTKFPKALLKLPQLEYMYFEGNEIASLPNEFFKMFPNLRWLDLRNNLLTRIPSAYLTSHSCLRDLLLEGNNIRNLPLELGLVKSLQGLNIAGNPLEFPPHTVTEHGTQYTLGYLRDLYEVKCSQLAGLELKLSEDAPVGCEHKSEVSDDWNTTASLMDLAKQREIMFQNKSHLNKNPDISEMQDSGNETNKSVNKSSKMINETKFKKMESGILVGISTLAEPTHLQVAIFPLACILMDTVSSLHHEEVGLACVVTGQQQDTSFRFSLFKESYLPLNTAIVNSDYVKFRMNEDKHLAKVKEQKRKIEEIIQKQKNETVLRKWRDVAKVLQQKKYSQRLLPGKDYKEPGEQAPFHIEMDMMKVLSKEDRLKADLEKDLALKQQRVVSPRTRARREQEKHTRIIELEARVRQHMSLMMERRKQPKGTPQHEKEVARKELDVAKELYSELFAERRDIEYHIKTVSASAARAVKAKKTKTT